MRFYIRANEEEKPTLYSVETLWEELEDGSGIMFTVFSDPDDILFEEVFDYADVDSDAIYDSAIDMAILALSQQYELTDEVIETIRNSGEIY